MIPDRKNDHKILLEGFFFEWKERLSLLQDKEILSIYFGGGTPSRFVDGIKILLKKIFGSGLRFSPKLEVTLEVNPEDVTPPLMAQIRKMGVNRISLGVQSLVDSSLQVLNRTHSAEKALEAIKMTKDAGIDNISIDLMYDLPNQTLSSWTETLQILPKSITHLSLYNLTIEPKTVFYKQRESLVLPTDEVSFKMLEQGVEQIEAAGLERYEISAFAREGMQAVHNVGYWMARPFLGFGPSAFSYFGKSRFRNCCHLKKWHGMLKERLSPVDFEEKLPYPRNLTELLAVQLRLLEGVDLGAFEKRHGKLPEKTHHALEGLESDGFLMTKSNVRLSEKGLLFYDSVASSLI